MRKPSPHGHRRRIAGVVIIWVAMGIYWAYWVRQQPWQAGVFASSLAPDAGEHAVPREVRAMKALAQRHPAPAYRLDQAFVEHTLIFQRATEFLYSFRISRHSPWLLAPDTHSPANCRLIDQQQNVALYECPR